MTRKEALIALRDAVRDGRWFQDAGIARSYCAKSGLGLHAAKISGAMKNSLDAAKALHEAVLPGWQIKRITENKNAGLWFVCVQPLQCFTPNAIGKSDNPARAWLLAIIEALISEAEE